MGRENAAQNAAILPFSISTMAVIYLSNDVIIARTEMGEEYLTTLAYGIEYHLNKKGRAGRLMADQAVIYFLANYDAEANTYTLFRFNHMKSVPSIEYVPDGSAAAIKIQALAELATDIND